MEYFVMILAGDAFLATLLTYMGISDAVIGIITSLSTFAFLFQMFSLLIVDRIKNVKKTVMILNCSSLMFFMLMYIIPFIPISVGAKSAIIILLFVMAYGTNFMVAGIHFKWSNSFVSPYKRGSFSAIKEIISLATGIALTLFAGFVVDSFVAAGQTEKSFIFITCAMLIFNIANFISLCFIKKQSVAMEEENKIKEKVSFKSVIANTVANKNFRNVVIASLLCTIPKSFTFGFLSTFKLKDLLLSIGTIQIINNIGHLARILISKKFGEFSDKHSFAVGLRYAYILEFLSFVAVIFTTKNTWWLIAVTGILNNMSLAGTNANQNNIIYSYVDSKYIVHALAVNNTIKGIAGLLTALIGAKFLSYVQASGNMIFGIHMYGQQAMACISSVIMLIGILFIIFVVEKQKVKKQ